jgi:hypothetical protein
VLLAFSRASSNRLADMWIAQATVAERLDLAPSTVCHHVAAAKQAGWIVVQHRNRIDNGMVVGMSNVTRLEFPVQWRTKLDEQRRQRAAERTPDRRRRGDRPGGVDGRFSKMGAGRSPNSSTRVSTRAAIARAIINAWARIVSPECRSTQMSGKS